MRSDSVLLVVLLLLLDGLVWVCLFEPLDDDDDDGADKDAEEEAAEVVEACSNICLVLITIANSFAHNKIGLTRLARVSPSF